MYIVQRKDIRSTNVEIFRMASKLYWAAENDVAISNTMRLYGSVYDLSD